jgi:hypothetical protein
MVVLSIDWLYPLPKPYTVFTTSSSSFEGLTVQIFGSFCCSLFIGGDVGLGCCG